MIMPFSFVLAPITMGLPGREYFAALSIFRSISFTSASSQVVQSLNTYGFAIVFEIIRKWQLPTPVPLHDFDRFPVFDDDPYPYGVKPAGGPALAPAGGGG